jgi:hypothetical protein
MNTIGWERARQVYCPLYSRRLRQSCIHVSLKPSKEDHEVCNLLDVPVKRYSKKLIRVKCVNTASKFDHLSQSTHMDS